MRPALLACSLLAIALGCSKGSKAPPLSGLAAVPASAQVVIAVDVARVIDSPLVVRAVDQLLMRDPALAVRWQQLHDKCKIDVAKLKHVILAIGPAAASNTGPGTGPVLMVVTGQLAETELSSCVRAMVGEGGGSLTAKDLAGRTLYQAKDGNRTMFFAFSRPDTVVLGSSEAYVTEALSTGKKVLDNPDLAKWIRQVDQKAPVWAAGRVDERVRGGLIKVTSGQLSAGPVAMLVAVDPTKGAKIELSAVMKDAKDAKTLESFAKGQLSLLALAAQAKSLGKVVDKVVIAADGEVVRFTATLGVEEVNLLISALDGGGTTEQDSPPNAGSGSAAGP